MQTINTSPPKIEVLFCVCGGGGIRTRYFTMNFAKLRYTNIYIETISG
jgi:hypothetical protein